MTVYVIHDDDDDNSDLLHYIPVEEHCPADTLLSQQVEYAIDAYRIKLSGYSRAELIQECKDRNRRGGNSRIGVSGSKADLMRRLLIDAAQSLDSSVNTMGDDNHDIDGDVVNYDDDDGDDNRDIDHDSDSDGDDQDEEEEDDGATLDSEVDSGNVYLSDSVDDDDDDHAAKDNTRSHKTIRSSSSSSSFNRSSSSSSFNRSTKDGPKASSAHKTIHAMTTKRGEVDMSMRMRKHDSSDDGDGDDMREVVMKVLRSCFGFTSFRPGQLWAIERCLTKKNSLLVLPTGAGKSLCYMLPTAVLAMTGGKGGGGMGGLTIVVSPLIALMQVRATA